MDQLFSVWLVPQKSDQEYLRLIIDNLATKYNCNPFIPHLTILGEITTPYKDLLGILDDTFKNFKPFSVKKTGMNQSDVFIKTVFIEIELSEILKNLFVKISSKTNKKKLETYKPHVSLIYQSMIEHERLKIIDSLSVKDNYIIDKIIITESNKPTQSSEDVKTWKIIYSKMLK